MTPDDLRLLSMQEALTENRPADSCWINNEILVVATLQGGRPRISTFSRAELLAWQKRAWALGKQERRLGFEELLAATYQRPALAMLQLEAV